MLPLLHLVESRPMSKLIATSIGRFSCPYSKLTLWWEVIELGRLIYILGEAEEVSLAVSETVEFVRHIPLRYHKNP
jgi:hypothetical protein